MTQDTYCIYCGKSPIPGEGFPFPCEASGDGSHRVVKKGTVKYRVRGPDGYTYKMTCIPKGFTLVETIRY